MIVHSVKHIFMRNITSYERKERIIFIIYLDKIPPKGSLVVECGKMYVHRTNNGKRIPNTPAVSMAKGIYMMAYDLPKLEPKIAQLHESS